MSPGAKLIAGVFFLLVTLVSAPAQDPPSEYQLKAAFLFNFAKFVDWPPEAFPETSSPFLVGVLGDNPFDDHLENTLRNKVIAGRRIVYQTVKSLEDARQVHILFISTSESRRLREVLNALRGAHVLTVGESPDFIPAGGMINFVRQEKKIRFQIHDEPARAAGLKINSKLLSLAVPISK